MNLKERKEQRESGVGLLTMFELLDMSSRLVLWSSSSRWRTMVFLASGMCDEGFRQTAFSRKPLRCRNEGSKRKLRGLSRPLGEGYCWKNDLSHPLPAQMPLALHVTPNKIVASVVRTWDIEGKKEVIRLPWLAERNAGR